MHLQENTLWNVTQYPLHHVTYAATKFEVAMFRRIYIYKKRDGRTEARMDVRTDGHLLGTSVLKLANIYPTLSLSIRQETLITGYLCPSFYGINYPSLVLVQPRKTHPC